MQGIYKWTNNLNNKIYIGKSVNLASRLRGYRTEVNRGSTRPIISALRKYGFENFTFEIIEDCDGMSKEELLKREQYWIDHYDAQNREKGYNILNADSDLPEPSFQGSKNIKARLTEEKVLDIRNMIYIMKISPAQVYKLYAKEISYDAFQKAYEGETWKNVDTSMIYDASANIKRAGFPKAKLTKEDVIKIRELAEQEGWSISEIYDTYYLGKCTRITIRRIVNYETWKNI